MSLAGAPQSARGPEPCERGRRRIDERNRLKIFVSRAALLALSLPVFGLGCRPGKPTVAVGCKEGMEQLLLGHLTAQIVATNPQVRVAQKFEFGDTAACFAALKRGELDVYPEYTQVALTRILKQTPKRNREAIWQTAKNLLDARHHIACLPPLGFEHARVLLTRKEFAEEKGLGKISDLRFLSRKMTAGFTPDFLDDPECYAALCAAYGLSFKNQPRRQDQEKLYRALRNGRVDLISGYTTDISIEQGGIVILADDFALFPHNDACLLVRQTLLNRVPSLEFTLKKLSRLLDDRTLRRLKVQVTSGKKDPKEVAAGFLKSGRVRP